ncbi:unnamed protein product [Agarophyton chilense]
MQLGADAYHQLLRAIEPSLLPPSDRRTRRARAVVVRLAAACQAFDPALTAGFKWSVAVSHDDAPNAVCVPGGRIMLTTGLLRMCAEEELAMVLAHEIAHAVNRHSAEKMQMHTLLWPIALLLATVFNSHFMSASLTRLLLELPFGRSLEREADHVGMIILTEACYDPRKAPSIFDKLARVTGEQQGHWLATHVKSIASTHPMSAQRAAQLKNKSAEMAVRYQHKCASTQHWIADTFAFASMQ